jgi:hypothetical protein
MNNNSMNIFKYDVFQRRLYMVESLLSNLLKEVETFRMISLTTNRGIFKLPDTIMDILSDDIVHSYLIRKGSNDEKVNIDVYVVTSNQLIVFDYYEYQGKVTREFDYLSVKNNFRRYNLCDVKGVDVNSTYSNNKITHEIKVLFRDDDDNISIQSYKNISNFISGLNKLVAKNEYVSSVFYEKETIIENNED